jgi:hypothetical protein
LAWWFLDAEISWVRLVRGGVVLVTGAGSRIGLVAGRRAATGAPTRGGKQWHGSSLLSPQTRSA